MKQQRINHKTQRSAKRVLIISFLLITAGIVTFATRSFSAVKPITACEPVGDARPLCGWQNPEDMVALPGTQQVIVSEYGGMDGARPGVLSLLDLSTEARRELYRGGLGRAAGAWGMPDCWEVSSQAFSPHGIHLSRRADGKLQLLAVQHGGRESVEMFEVAESPDGWNLVWRGCAVAPARSALNDVVATPEGGFLVTNMLTKREGTIGQMFEYVKDSLLGVESGHVLVWQPDEGFSRLPGSEGKLANGIALSPDGKTVFVNYGASGELRRIDRRSGQVEASNDALPPLDNSSWSPDGRLLVAGLHAGALEMMACMNIKTGSCPGAFAIMAVDPETLASETLYEGGSGTPSGAGTVGLQVGDSLLIGTFAGDRIVRVTPQQGRAE